MLKTTSWPSSEPLPDARSLPISQCLLNISPEWLMSSRTWEKLSSSPSFLGCFSHWVRGPHCAPSTVSRNVGILWDPLFSLTYYVQLSTSSYKVALLISLQSWYHFPSSGYWDVWPGLCYPFPNWAPYLQSCPTPFLWRSDLSIVKSA